MNVPTYKIEAVRVTDSFILEEIYRLRAEAWQEIGVSSSNFPDGKWQDEHDTHAMHWAIFDKSRNVIAAARMCIHEKLEDVPDSHCYLGFESEITLPVASFNRLIVKREFRLLGLSKQMDLIRIAGAKTKQVGSLVGIVYERTGQKRVNNLIELGFRALTNTFSVRDEFTEQGLGNVMPLLKRL